MSPRRFAAAGAVASIVSVIAFARADDADQRRAGLAAWEATYRVLESPRCRNCHPAGDRPLHGDDGHPHAMNVSQKGVRAGLACTTCHRGKNVEAPHAPPGVPGWRMPDPEMPLVFEGRSSHDLCEQLKDPARNGRKSAAELVHHVASDPFVLWAWSPGPGRTTPPSAHADFVKEVDAWVRAGAPCP